MLPSNSSFLSFGVVFHFHDLPCLWGERVVFSTSKLNLNWKALSYERIIAIAIQPIQLMIPFVPKVMPGRSTKMTLKIWQDAASSVHPRSLTARFSPEKLPKPKRKGSSSKNPFSVFSYVKLCGCMMVYVHFIESTTLSEPGLDKSSILNTMPRETPRNDVQEICF